MSTVIEFFKFKNKVSEFINITSLLAKSVSPLDKQMMGKSFYLKISSHFINVERMKKIRILALHSL